MVIITDRYPLKESSINVITPNILLPDLITLVAPILPDPFFLISVLVNNFVNISPKGIDPKK